MALPAAADAQTQILSFMRHSPVPVNSGPPDYRVGFTFCRLKYDNVRRGKKEGWNDDYPASDFNFLSRLEELTTTTISRWKNGDPGYMQVTVMDPDLFRCPYLKMQAGGNYDFVGDEADRMREYLLKGGFLWMDDNWDPEWEWIRPNIERLLPGYQIIDLMPSHPMFSVLYGVDPLPQIPSISSWRRSGDSSEIYGAKVHYYAVFGENDRLMVLVSMNSDVSDSWEREGDNPDYFKIFSGKGYAMGVNVLMWILAH
jgi:hypothetical protein